MSTHQTWCRELKIQLCIQLVSGNRVKLQIGCCIGLWAGYEPTTLKPGSSKGINPNLPIIPCMHPMRGTMAAFDRKNKIFLFSGFTSQCSTVAGHGLKKQIIECARGLVSEWEMTQNIRNLFYNCCAWAGGNFFHCLRKVPPAHSCSACVVQEIGCVDIGLVEKPFQHTCLYHLQDCVVNGD